MPQLCPNYDAISKKKVLQRNSNGFFIQNQVISKKKVAHAHMLYYVNFVAKINKLELELISKCHLMGPFRATGSLMGPGVIIPPCPPLSVALLSSTHWCVLYFDCPSTSLPCVTTDSDRSSTFICASSWLPVPY